MTSSYPMSHALRDVAATAEERRAALEFEEQERAEQRRIKIESQTSPLNSPQERIRIWEELHRLRLPQRAEHKLVHVIAMQTALTVAQIQQEQQRRATPHGTL